MKPPLVIFVHGIRTHAKWQKIAASILSLPKYAIPNCPYDFGRYGIHRFIFESSNKKAADKFHEEYTTIVNKKDYDIDLNDYLKRPSIIAHSLGSYLVGTSMLKHKNIKFDKIILCGSILPTDFDWLTLINRDQVNSVLNEYSEQDFWPTLSAKFVRGTGNSGREGFLRMRKCITNHSFPSFKHSDYFQTGHMEDSWIPFLQKQPSCLLVTHGRQIENITEFGRILNLSGKIDDICFKEFPEYPEDRVPRGLSLKWIAVNPDIYTFLFDRRDGEIKGYINAMPIKDGTYEKIKKEGIGDKNVKPEDIMPFDTQHLIKIYLMSIAISPDVRQTSFGLLQPHFERLFCGFIEKLRFHAIESKTKVTEFVSIGWTDEGQTLCENIGMKIIGKYREKFPIYSLDLNDPATLKQKRLSDEVRKLIEFYRSIKQ